MKIAVITQNFPIREQPYRGHSVYQTLRRIARKAEVEVFAAHIRYPPFLEDQNRPWNVPDPTYTVPEVKACYLSYPGLPVLTRGINGWVSASRLYSILRHRRFDVILSYWIYPDGFAAVEVGRKLGIPTILKAIGSDLNSHTGISAILGKRAMRQADAVLTVSRALAHKVIACGIDAEKVHPILNGCDGSIFRLADRRAAQRELRLSPENSYVLFVGRLALEKGLRELVRAFAETRKLRPQLHLLLVGEGPARAELTALVQTLGLHEHVSFIEPVPSFIVARWMAACDVFAFPSYDEGCPNVVLEALHTGRPVVATNVGGIPELVTSNCGILIPVRSVQALSHALVRALARDWDTEAIAREHNRPWEVVADETLAVCKSVTFQQPALLDPTLDYVA